MAEEPIDRLKGNLKSPYPENDSNWEDVLVSFASEFDDIEGAIKAIQEQDKVETATGEQLEKIGSLVALPRNSGETDAHYRGRLKVQLRKFTGDATVNDIKETAAVLLQANSDDVRIDENLDGEPAMFRISIWEDDLNNVSTTAEEFKSFIDEIRAAGVRTEELKRGTFMHRSEQDFINGVNEPGRGYYDPNDGEQNGTYAGLL